ncbi:MAG: MarR family transcriptional regulator [Solirubrobacterales bacterium]|jgi:DNA-binding Lrp family transcriptional regulator|nr:MarR family transcriptional regulator [Solirubrobacterales bacterium]
MDSSRRISARRLADELGTSTPRVTRAARSLGLAVGSRGASSHFTAEQAARLRDALGVDARVDGLTTTHARALAALARAPLGLRSTRALARRAGLSPTSAGRAIKALEQAGLILREETVLPGRRATRAQLLLANVSSPRWPSLAPGLAQVRPPAKEEPPARVRRIPPRLRHLFWNTAPSQLDIDKAGPYIARRLITTGDIDGLAWGSAHLRASDWQDAAKARGLDDATRALAHNLARVAR